MRSRPVLDGAELYYRSVFAELTESRNYTKEGQPLPIPLTQFLAYFTIWHITNLDERETLISRIRAMDREYLTVAREQAAEAVKKAKGGID